MSIKVDYSLQMKVTETFGTSQQNASAAVVVHEITGTNGSLNADSTVPATTVIDKRMTLTAGTATIDLTAAPGKTVDGTAVPIDLTGLKLQMIKLKAHADNTSRVKVAQGASHPYYVGGVTGAFDSLGAGESALHEFKDTLQEVGATISTGVYAKTIDITSAMAAAIIDVQLVFG